MVRTIIADEKLLPTLNDISRKDGFNIGLILGQCAQQKDYVVHFAQTQLPGRNKNKENIKEDGHSRGDNLVSNVNDYKITDIKETWLTAQSRSIIRMLPGGMWILGLYIIGPGDVFSDKQSLNKVRSLLPHIYNSSKNNPYLNGSTPSNTLVVFNFCSLSKKYSCKCFDVGNLNMAMNSVEWKFQPNPTKWFQIDSCFNCGKTLPYYFSQANAVDPLKKKMKEILHTVAEIIENSVCTIDGEFRNNSELLEMLRKDKPSSKIGEESANNTAKKEEGSFKVNLYVQQEPRKVNQKVQVDTLASSSSLKCSGYLSSRVFLHQKATVEDTIKAVKDDIIRSWAARLEMHWDSYDEPKKGQRDVLHILPRRVLCPLPDSGVSFSEYLFPDEGILDAVNSLEEQLGFDVHPDSVNQDFEQQFDPNKANALSQESSKEQIGRGATSQQQKTTYFLIIGIAFAVIVLLLSIIIQFVYKPEMNISKETS